jgi:hypothetical protein
MNPKVVVSGAVAIGAALVSIAAAQERTMNVRQGPETVFAQPVEQILPELVGARATDENGRVGGELVFWGYRLADGRPAFFFACAQLPDVDCGARVQLICPDRTTVLATSEASGAMLRRECRPVAFAAPGDTRPGCVDNVDTAPLQVGLVTCG